MRLKRQRLKHIQHLQTSSNLPVGVEPALLKPPRELDRDWTRGGRVVGFFPALSFIFPKTNLKMSNLAAEAKRVQTGDEKTL